MHDDLKFVVEEKNMWVKKWAIGVDGVHPKVNLLFAHTRRRQVNGILVRFTCLAETSTTNKIQEARKL